MVYAFLALSIKCIKPRLVSQNFSEFCTSLSGAQGWHMNDRLLLLAWLRSQDPKGDKGIKTRQTHRKAGIGGLGFPMQKTQHPRSSACLFYAVE